MDSNFNLLIQAIPLEGEKYTNFEFEFSVEGEEWPYYMKAHELLKIQDDPDEYYWLVTITLSLIIVCFLGFPTGCCMMACCQKVLSSKKSFNEVAITNDQDK